MKFFLVLLQFFFYSNFMFSQVSIEQLGTKEHFDSLRNWLTLDIPLKSDSSFVFEYGNKDYTFYLNKKRPDISKALSSIQKLRENEVTRDTVIGRLRTLLWEMDARYLCEFSFSIDFYFDIYHRCLPNQHSWIPGGKKIFTELDVIKELELTIQFLEILKKDRDLILDIYLGDIPKYPTKKEYYSSTFRAYGYIEISFFKSYVRNHLDYYLPLVKLRIEKEISKSQVFKIFHLIGFFDRNSFQKIDCQAVEKVITENTVAIFFKYLDEVNQSWEQLACVRKITNKYNNHIQPTNTQDQ